MGNSTPKMDDERLCIGESCYRLWLTIEVMALYARACGCNLVSKAETQQKDIDSYERIHRDRAIRVYSSLCQVSAWWSLLLL